MDLYLAFALFTAGNIVGCILTQVVFRITHAYTTLKLDTSNPEKDVYTLDIYDLSVLKKKKYLNVRIINNIR